MTNESTRLLGGRTRGSTIVYTLDHDNHHRKDHVDLDDDRESIHANVNADADRRNSHEDEDVQQDGLQQDGLQQDGIQQDGIQQDGLQQDRLEDDLIALSSRPAHVLLSPVLPLLALSVALSLLPVPRLLIYLPPLLMLPHICIFLPRSLSAATSTPQSLPPLAIRNLTTLIPILLSIIFTTILIPLCSTSATSHLYLIVSAAASCMVSSQSTIPTYAVATMALILSNSSGRGVAINPQLFTVVLTRSVVYFIVPPRPPRIFGLLSTVVLPPIIIFLIGIFQHPDLLSPYLDDQTQKLIFAVLTKALAGMALEIPSLAVLVLSPTAQARKRTRKGLPRYYPTMKQKLSALALSLTFTMGIIYPPSIPYLPLPYLLILHLSVLPVPPLLYTLPELPDHTAIEEGFTIQNNRGHVETAVGAVPWRRRPVFSC